MAVHHFTLILHGDVGRRMPALHAAGCGDAAFGEIDGYPYADFARRAPTLEAAINTASLAVTSTGIDVVTAFRIQVPPPS